MTQVLDPMALLSALPNPIRGWLLFSKVWGSYSHDTQLPESDVDYVGVYVAYQKDLFGLHPPADTITHEKPDVQLHEAKKFCDLLLKGNPGIIEMLFTERMFWADPHWQPLRDARRRFLCKAVVKQYLGYSTAQLQRLEHGKPIHSKGGEYGLKWAYHMVRVAWDALRIVQGGEPLAWKEGEEKARIMEIRRGEWSKERVIKEATDTIAKVDALKPWPLPDEADEAFLNDWLLGVRAVEAPRTAIETLKDVFFGTGKPCEPARAIQVTIESEEVGYDPPILIYHVELSDKTGSWTETFGSKEQLEAFKQGLRAASGMMRFALEVDDKRESAKR